MQYFELKAPTIFPFGNLPSRADELPEANLVRTLFFKFFASKGLQREIQSMGATGIEFTSHHDWKDSEGSGDPELAALTENLVPININGIIFKDDFGVCSRHLIVSEQIVKVLSENGLLTSCSMEPTSFQTLRLDSRWFVCATCNANLHEESGVVAGTVTDGKSYKCASCASSKD